MNHRGNFLIHRLRLLSSLGLALALLVPAACSNPDTRVLVVGIDRTGVARTRSWSSEVATVTAGLVDEAFAAGLDELDMIGIGHDMNETGRVARVNLRLDCPTKDRCDEDRRRLRTQIAQVAGNVAASPVKETGTALIEAFETAGDICAGHSCRVVMITDGQDSRLNQAASVDALLAQVRPTLTQLRGVSVQLAGLGADGSSARAVARAERFWIETLRAAGAVDVRIGRSL
jgi:hypothetical protein